MAETETKPIPEVKAPTVPEYITKMNSDYQAKVSHTFILHGNIGDYPSNSSQEGNILQVLSRTYDSNVMARHESDAKLKAEILKKKPTRVMAAFSISDGLQFFHEKSEKEWKAIFKQFVDALPADQKPPDTAFNIDTMLQVLNTWFRCSELLQQNNLQAKSKGDTSLEKPEVIFTIAIQDADAIFPCGQISQLSGDRAPIVYLRNWAREESKGQRNRIILLTKHLTDLHESLRGGDSGVSSILVRYPTMEDREEWLNNFDRGVKLAAKEGRSISIAGRKVHSIEFADGFDSHTFAIQAAGMSRRRMRDVIMTSWLTKAPVDFTAVRAVKQRAVQEEFEGLVEFFEPEHGFEQIGGQEHVKLYFQRKIIGPLQKGDRRLCSKGVLLTGPPGTGKSALAKALAKEAKLNFMIGNLGRVFGGIVGETESRTRKFFEAVDAAAPVIVFLDEVESVLSSGRSSPGDSGTAARVFNSLMTWLSDESRAGRVVVVAATNRPDLLDAALIRSGRMDAILAVLPPRPGDSKGRTQILSALARKHSVKFAPELKDTFESADGLGRLMKDERIWTGAEMEVVLKEAFDNAVFAESKNIGLVHWNKAMEDILPNTQQVEGQIELALYYVNHLGYCPEDWRDKASNKKELQQHIAEMREAGGFSDEREI